jgi:hypothetical protein
VETLGVVQLPHTGCVVQHHGVSPAHMQVSVQPDSRWLYTDFWSAFSAKLSPVKYSDPQALAASAFLNSDFYLLNLERPPFSVGCAPLGVLKVPLHQKSWQFYKVYLACFPSLRDHSPSLPIGPMSQNWFTHIFSKLFMGEGQIPYQILLGNQKTQVSYLASYFRCGFLIY